VWTPPLGSGCLPGVTRENIMGEIHAQGIEIGEKTLTPAEVESADEVFITSTTRNLLPVLEIEGKAVGRGARARTALEEVFAAYVRKYVGEQAGGASESACPASRRSYFAPPSAIS